MNKPIKCNLIVIYDGCTHRIVLYNKNLAHTKEDYSTYVCSISLATVQSIILVSQLLRVLTRQITVFVTHRAI